MLAGYETSPRERIFRNLFKKASDTFDAEDFEESERLCHVLLTYTDLSIYHKAGCHRILSLGDNDFLWHAEQAVEYYEKLFYPDGQSTGDHLLSDAQIRARDDILENAYRNLAQAEQDHVEITCDYNERCKQFRTIYGCEPAEEDVSKTTLDRHSKKYILAVNGTTENYDYFLEKVFAKRKDNKSEEQERISR